MLVSLGEFEQGLREYWSEIDRRARHVQAREQAFDDLAAAYAGKTPPHFNRAELTQIMEWKHTDARWFNRAMQGINAVSDAKIAQITSNISADPRLAVRGLNGAFQGVGVASASAIVTAARPDLYAVIDVFALIAIDHHYTFSWIDRMARNKEGQLQPTYFDYPSYVEFCRIRARELSKVSGKDWIPRKVDMALWGLGKRLGANKHLACH